jgi:hypothetical protein
MPTTPVSDEVWNQLDPDRARPTRQTRRTVAAVVAVATFFAIVTALGFISGLFRPSVWLETNDILRINHSAHTFTYTFFVYNDDWIDERLTAVTSTDPAVRTRLTSPTTISHGDRQFITVTAKVDCAHVPSYEPQLRLHFDRMWGDMTETVQPDPINPTRMKQYVDIFMNGAPYTVCH